MAKDPADRYAQAGEMANALLGALSEMVRQRYAAARLPPSLDYSIEDLPVEDLPRIDTEEMSLIDEVLGGRGIDFSTFTLDSEDDPEASDADWQSGQVPRGLEGLGARVVRSREPDTVTQVRHRPEARQTR